MPRGHILAMKHRRRTGRRAYEDDVLAQHLGDEPQIELQRAPAQKATPGELVSFCSTHRPWAVSCVLDHIKPSLASNRVSRQPRHLLIRLAVGRGFDVVDHAGDVLLRDVHVRKPSMKLSMGTTPISG